MRKNKRAEITLNPDDYELLLSLCLRFNCSKSEIVSQALKIMSGKKKHDIHIMFREAFNPEYLSNTEYEELKKVNKK